MFTKISVGGVSGKRAAVAALTCVLFATGCGSSNTSNELELTVVSTTPTDGAAGVAVNAPLQVQFSAAMDPATTTTQSFRVVAESGTEARGEVTCSGDTATFTPAVPLMSATRYTATITGQATSAGGIPLRADYRWSFVTADQTDDIAPYVVSTTPADGERCSTAECEIAIEFSDAMDEATVTSETVYVTDEAGRKIGGSVVAVLASTFRFLPAEKLLAQHVYRGVITTGVRDRLGNAMAAEHRWTFRGLARQVGAPTAVEQRDANAGRVFVGVDALGNGVAIWTELDGTTVSLWANRFSASGGWGTAERIDDGRGRVSDPQLAVSAGGEAIAVWEASATVEGDSIRASRFTPSSGWSEAFEISAAGRWARPAIDDIGRIVVIWQDSGAAVAKTFDAGAWSAAESLETNGVVYRTTIAFSPAGEAFAAWELDCFDGGENAKQIRGSRYTFGQGWSVPETLDDTLAGDDYEPALAFTSAGDGVLVWSSSESSWRYFNALRYLAASGWDHASGSKKLVSAMSKTSHSMAADSQGNLFLLSSTTGKIYGCGEPSTASICARLLPRDESWSDPVAVDRTFSVSAAEPAVAAYGNKTASAIWLQDENLYLAHSGDGHTWWAPEVVDNSAEPVVHAGIATNTEGTGLIVWVQGPIDQRSVWAATLR